ARHAASFSSCGARLSSPSRLINPARMTAACSSGARSNSARSASLAFDAIHQLYVRALTWARIGSHIIGTEVGARYAARGKGYAARNARRSAIWRGSPRLESSELSELCLRGGRRPARTEA